MIRRPVVVLLAFLTCSACSADESAQLPTPRRAKQTDDPNALIGPAVPGRRAVKADEPEPVASLGADLPGRGSPLRAAARWTISSQAVGTLTVDAKLHEPARGFEGSYVTSFYADAQPLEGFALDDPPVLAMVSGGPFAKWGKKHPGGTPSEALTAQASQLARAGKLHVRMIVITDPRPKTELGIGVGDDYLTFQKRYPALPAPSHFPGLWEEPSCIIQQGTLWFFFDRCDTRAQAKLIRIVVKQPEVVAPKRAPRKIEVDTEY